MSSVDKYESLKDDGTWMDRIKYVLSLPDKNEIETHLKLSSTTSYDDLAMFIFLSKSTKNEKNLLEIFKSNSNSLPVRQRARAGKHWLELVKDAKRISDFITESINDKNIPRYLKHQLLRSLHQIKYLRKSTSFIYDLICRLTETNHHHQYNIDEYLVPFCSKDQVLDLFSRWSIKRLEQIEFSYRFYTKLIRYQPLVVIHLLKSDLDEKINDNEKFSSYFNQNGELFELLAKKQAKELVDLTKEYINQLEKHKRSLPAFIQSSLKYFFKKVPDQMIELITIIASNQPGTIKYQRSWSSEGSELGNFQLPRSFSIQNHVRLFSALYDTCKWSANHTINLLSYMLAGLSQKSKLHSIKKERKWLADIVIEKRIGKDLFLKKLLKEGDENTLKIFRNYSELTTPLSRHLLSQYERKGVVLPSKRLSLLRYQLMTQEVFDEFLFLFQQTGSDVKQRPKNYSLFFRCALATNEEFVEKVLQWIAERFTNERILSIEYFLKKLSSYLYQFHLQILTKSFQSIETIINIAMKHSERTFNTLEPTVDCGIALLQCIEHYPNNEQKEKIRAFAIQIIKQCYSKNKDLEIDMRSISKLYPEVRRIVADILISDVFLKLISKSMFEELNTLLHPYKIKAWWLSQIDPFLNSFFTESLPSSPKLQSAFNVYTHTYMIELFLKNKSTRLDRVKQLMKIDQIFFINKHVQRLVLHSGEYRQFIDQLIQDDKCLTPDKLTTTQSKLASTLKSSKINIKLPGFNTDLLICCSHLLTGKQQEHITRIILNDYLQSAVTSSVIFKSLSVLRHLTHTYDITLKWIDSKQGTQLAITNANEASGGRTQDATVKPLIPILICLPAAMDLTSQNSFNYFEFLQIQLNASNAKYVSDAMLIISRKIPDEIFLKHYLEFVRNGQFQKLGVTANKEYLRLLREYVSDPSLIQSVIKPLWDSQPPQDVRACLVKILLRFLGKSNSIDDQTTIWEILEKAADDDYLPVVNSSFSIYPPWSLSYLKSSSDKIYEAFVNRIQFRILDHPTSLQARLWAWTYIDHEYCDADKLIQKAQQICIQFDKDGNTLWTKVLEKIVSIHKQQKISSSNIIIDVIKKMMSHREEIDSKQNAIDNQHDLPVYHRIQQLLTILNSQIDQFDNEKKVSFRSLTPIILQFDKTLAPSMATLLIKIAQNKEDLEQVLESLQENLPEDYFERILTELSTPITQGNSCSFIQQFNPDEKLELAQWFIEEKNRALFVFDLLKNNVFNQPGIDREQCQNLLRQIRQSEDLFIRQEAMEYTVPW